MALTARQRILRVLTPEYGGDRKRTVLVGLIAAQVKGTRQASELIDDMAGHGEIVVRRDGDRGGTMYGLPT